MSAGAHSPARAIGLMSGTSVDGIDGVLVSMTAREVAIEATVSLAFPAPLRAQIDALIAQPAADLDQVGRLDTHLGHLYARAANQLKAEVGAGAEVGEQAVAVVGCHGQTIRHRPDGEFPFTRQLGNGALVAHLTGLPVVTDFRSADMAAGGQGAPLAPGFHRAVFASKTEHRAIVNLGGIANITHLPAGDCPAVTGFDTGPANTLLDGWCRRHFNAPFDRHGDHAAAGTVQRKLLDALLADAYFAQPPPKSTGREYFNQDWLAEVLTAEREFAALAAADVLATLTALSAATVAEQLNRLTPPPDAVYACGGGVHNRTLMAMLGERCHGALHTTSTLGIDPQWVEACAFAWMAQRTLQRAPATLPAVTGAAQPTIAGAIYFPG